eukprot:3494326-Rhodomonas_salina.3
MSFTPPRRASLMLGECDGEKWEMLMQTGNSPEQIRRASANGYCGDPITRKCKFASPLEVRTRTRKGRKGRKA